jgi:hypothetical protein
MVAAPIAGIGTFGSGALDVASALGESKMADFLRERNSTDGLIKRAFDSARQDYVPTKVIPKTVDELASQGYNQAIGNKTKGLLGPASSQFEPGSSSVLGSKMGDVTDMIPSVNPVTGKTEFIPNPSKNINPGSDNFPNPRGPNTNPFFTPGSPFYRQGNKFVENTSIPTQPGTSSKIDYTGPSSDFKQLSPLESRQAALDTRRQGGQKGAITINPSAGALDAAYQARKGATPSAISSRSNPENVVMDSVNQMAQSNQGDILTRQLRDTVGNKLSKSDFDKAVLSLGKKGKLQLSTHDNPAATSLAQRNAMVPTSKGNYAVSISPTGK